METYGWLSLVPVVLAVALALLTKNCVMSLAIACIVGCFIADMGIFGLSDLMLEALGTPDFIWTALIILMFGVLVAYYEKSGAISGFTRIVNRKNMTKKGVQLIAWALGLFCFADSMSPVFVGSTMRKLADKARISREKLAFISDATASPLAVICPYSSWPGYAAGCILMAQGLESLSEKEALGMVFRSIPLNFYAILCVLLVFLIAMGLVKDYGPMKKAEALAETAAERETEAVETGAAGSIPERVFLNFILPTILLVGIAAATFFIEGEPRILEPVLIIVVLMSISLVAQGMPLKELNATFEKGIKDSMPALLVLAVAYPLNTLSKNYLGTGAFIIQITEGILKPQLLPFGIFFICTLISFATGTSWGTYAICMPLVLPLAMSVTGGTEGMLFLACVAAVLGGGVFGDHCSPVSDTTIMASMGSGCDHIEHVKTQLPYALTCAGAAAVMYLVLGFIAA